MGDCIWPAPNPDIKPRPDKGSGSNLESGLTMEIQIYPQPVLRCKAEPVAEIDQDTIALLDEMVATMRKAEGIGLAAVQVGIARRVIVVDVTAGEQGPLRLINPRIVSASDELSAREEGCLSIPGVTAPVKRPARVVVEATDETGSKLTIEAEDLLATCLQHEIDHLDGILFIDHISRLRRRRVLAQYRKLQEESQQDNA